MTTASDPAEIVAPRDPALYAPRRRLGLGVWAVVVFGLVCLALGAGLARFGRTAFPHAKPPAAAAPVSDVASAPPTYPVLPPSVAAAAPAPDIEIGRLEARLAVLENGQQRAIDAAAAALAAATLADAAGTARPFSQELAGLGRMLPLSSDLRALNRLAQTGAPTRSGLAAEFEALAGRADVAARDPGRAGDFLAKLRHALSRIVSIRQVGATQGSTPDALLGRAQKLLNEGDIEGALAAIEPLPAGAQTILAPWRATAERRVEIDRHIAALRADALAGLVQVTRSPAAAPVGTP